MKKYIKWAFSCLVAVFCSVAMTSCEVDVEGQHLYEVTTSDDTTEGSDNSFHAYAESTVLGEVKAIGGYNPTENQYYFVLEGSRNACTKKIIAAVNKGMDKVEAFEDYDTTLIVVDEATVVIKNDGKVLFSRKFKKQNNRD